MQNLALNLNELMITGKTFEFMDAQTGEVLSCSPELNGRMIVKVVLTKTGYRFVLA